MEVWYVAHKLDDSDKLAAATLAAARCAARGAHDAADYVASYSEVEKLFIELREAESQAQTAAFIELMKRA